MPSIWFFPREIHQLTTTLFLSFPNLSVFTTDKKIGTIPISAGLAGRIRAYDRGDEALASLSTILLTQSADKTLKNSQNSFLRWKRFAVENDFPVLPPTDEESKPAFQHGFDLFVLQQFQDHSHRRIKKTGVTRPNKPGAFTSVFTGINHMFEHFLDRPRMDTPLLKKARRSYTRLYKTLPKKAKPMEFKHLLNLLALLRTCSEPYIVLVVKVTILAWFSAGRWSCIDRIDMQRTFSNSSKYVGIEGKGLNPSPCGTFSYIYWKERKNIAGLSATVLPTLKDKNLDPRTNFLDIVSTFNREKSTKLIPNVFKRKGVWVVDPNPNASCSYAKFLPMFRHVMFLAGNDSEAVYTNSDTPSTEWTLHCNRRGFVKTARAAMEGKQPLLWEVILRQGGWSPSSVDTAFAYNDVDPATHAKTLREMYDNVTRGRQPNPLAPSPSCNNLQEGRPCRIKKGTVTLMGRLLPQTLPNTNLVRVRLNGSIQIVPKNTVTYTGII